MARPTARFMLSHPAHIIALGFGSGLSPVAPGTVGTLWAWLAFLVLQIWGLTDVHWALLIAAAAIVAMFRFKVGIFAVLGAASAAGVALYLLGLAA